MIDLNAVERAGRVRRWHCHPDMCHVVDTVRDHGLRVMRLASDLFPGASHDLLTWCEYHDFGEYATGDIPHPVKQIMPPEMRAWFKAREQAALLAILPDMPRLPHWEAARLELCDRLDAYQTVKRHRPDILDRDGWPEDRNWLMGNAAALGVFDQVCAVLK